MEIVTNQRLWEYSVVQGYAFAILFSAYKGSRKASFFDETVIEKTTKKRKKVDTCHDFCNARSIDLAMMEEQKSTLSSTSLSVTCTLLWE